jgi:uncharacterized damage-inducible protein DinB
MDRYGGKDGGVSSRLCLEVAIRATLRSRDNLSRSAEAIPPDKRLWSPSEYMPHCVGIVAHCATSNLFFASAYTGSPLPYLTKTEKEEAIAACDTLEKAIHFLNSSVNKICDNLSSIIDERLEENIIMPWGERMPLALGLLAPANHMDYHDGQLNTYQLFLGDLDPH